jgi:hypothetical protein
MKPIKWKHYNATYVANQKGYQPLPALKLDTEQGEVISCWKLTIWERIKLLITGRIWMSLFSFNKPLTPSFLTTKRKEVYAVNEKLPWYKKLKKAIHG